MSGNSMNIIGFKVGLCFPVLVVASLMRTGASAQESKDVNAPAAVVNQSPVGQFFADASLVSYVSGKEIATYSSLGSGGAGPGGTWGAVASASGGRFSIQVVGQLKADRFIAAVHVKPDQQDKQIRAQDLEWDLSDLNPRSLEVGRDDDGRIYRLSVMPRILVPEPPRQFKVGDLRQDHWSFPGSPVIVNDQDYIGQLSMSGGSLVWCDIPGISRIEFSLHHLTDAQPIGTLKDGVISIAHESGTALTISNVKNGAFPGVLSGGPYRVWVRWNKPSQTAEEARQILKQQIVTLKERVKDGGMSLPPGTIERLEKMSEGNRTVLMSSGVREIKPTDLVEPAE